jgi:hypothetical protein
VLRFEFRERDDTFLSLGFGSSACCGALALAAADATLGRDAGSDLALTFFGAAVLGLWDFEAERVVMVLGSIGSRRRKVTLAPPKAPQIARRALGASPSDQLRPADAHSNASFAAEVQTFSKAGRRVRRLG